MADENAAWFIDGSYLFKVCQSRRRMGEEWETANNRHRRHLNRGDHTPVAGGRNRGIRSTPPAQFKAAPPPPKKK